MLCPICLTYEVEKEAVAQVRGTQYCNQHAREALLAPERPMANRRQMSFFTAPSNLPT